MKSPHFPVEFIWPWSASPKGKRGAELPPAAKPLALPATQANPALLEDALAASQATSQIEAARDLLKRLRLGTSLLIALPVLALVFARFLPEVSLLAHASVAIVALTMRLLSDRMLAAFESTTTLADTSAKWRDLSTTDIVTGGYNRRGFEQALEAEISRAARYGHPVSLLVFDLDNFKAVNDACGHAAGDQVLREVLRGAMAAVREVDTVARFGGDEFCVLLPETSLKEACSAAMRLQEEVVASLALCFGPDSLQSRITLSIGIATSLSDIAISADELLSRADAHLYEAKHAGKNQIVW